ncbi:hypothetical protein XENOCAPTIV_001976, partial [Xenoophorus captivus]
TEMTAAASLRNRELVGVRKAKILFLILTLLSSLCPASSWMDKEDLKEINENIQKLKRDILRKKVNNMLDSAFIPHLLEDLSHQLGHFAKTLKNILPNFPAAPEFFEYFKGFLKTFSDYANKCLQNQDAQIKEHEDKLAQLEALIRKLAQGKSADM